MERKRCHQRYLVRETKEENKAERQGREIVLKYRENANFPSLSYKRRKRESCWSV